MVVFGPLLVLGLITRWGPTLVPPSVQPRAGSTPSRHLPEGAGLSWGSRFEACFCLTPWYRWELGRFSVRG